MLRKTVIYEDYDGNERTEICHFHLNRTECMEIALDLPEGIVEQSENTNEPTINLVEKLGTKGIFDFIKNLVKKSYGIKSSDGRRFEKSEEILSDFMQTPMFDAIITELTTDDKAASDFINEVIPAKLINETVNGTTKPALKAKKANK